MLGALTPEKTREVLARRERAACPLKCQLKRQEHLLYGKVGATLQ